MGIYEPAYIELVQQGKVTLNLGVLTTPAKIRSIIRGISQQKYLDPNKQVGKKIVVTTSSHPITGEVILELTHMMIKKSTLI
jgi:hypothetical protein